MYNDLNKFSMCKKTDTWVKYGVIKAVVNNLKRSGKHPKELAYLESSENVDSAYNIAKRYARNYIHLKDDSKKEVFLGIAKELGKKWLDNGEIWLPEDDRFEENSITDKSCEVKAFDVVNETNEEFLKSIEVADKSIRLNKDVKKFNEVSVKPIEINVFDMIASIKNNSIIQFSKKFFDKLNIRREFVGKYNGVDLMFCEDLNCLVGII